MRKILLGNPISAETAETLPDQKNRPGLLVVAIRFLVLTQGDGSQSAVGFGPAQDGARVAGIRRDNELLGEVGQDGGRSGERRVDLLIVLQRFGLRDDDGSATMTFCPDRGRSGRRTDRLQEPGAQALVHVAIADEPDQVQGQDPRDELADFVAAGAMPVEPVVR